jgi:hypothetical protein
MSCSVRHVQPHPYELAMSVCGCDGARNGVVATEQGLAEWSEWDDAGPCEWVLGVDVLDGEAPHPASAGSSGRTWRRGDGPCSRTRYGG